MLKAMMGAVRRVRVIACALVLSTVCGIALGQSLNLAPNQFPAIALGAQVTDFAPDKHGIGASNYLYVLPTAGGSYLNSLSAAGYSDGDSVLIVNTSLTDNLIFQNAGGGRQDGQFVNPGSGNISVPPLGNATYARSSGKWTFVSQSGIHTNQFAIDSYSPNANGIVDDSVALNAAISACAAAGGGTIPLGPHRYYIANNITLAPNCTISTPQSLVGYAYKGGNSNFAGIGYAILLNPAYTITMQSGSSLQNVAILNSTLNLNPVTTRDSLNSLANFSGTAILTDQANGANDVTLSGNLIGGFALGVDLVKASRVRMWNNDIDATNCVALDSIADIPYLAFNHCFPLMTPNNAAPYETFAISALANSSGVYEVTFGTGSTGSLPVTGDTMWLTGQTGASSASGKWIVTVIDSTHLTLNSSIATGATPTGNTLNGGNVITTLSSMAGIGVGSNIIGTGIPASTTVIGLWPAKSSIILSNTMTATGTGVTLTVSDPAYSTGGTIALDAQQRSGYGFQTANTYYATNTAILVGNFAFGHNMGFHVGGAATQTNLVSNQVDNHSALNDPTTTGFQVDGTASGTQVIGGSVQSVNTALRVNITAGEEAQVFTNMQLNLNASSGPTIEADGGYINLSGITSSGGVTGAMEQPIFMADAVSNFFLGDSTLPTSVNFYFQSAVGKNHFFTGVNALSATVYGGIHTLNGQAILGGTTACSLQTCGTFYEGPQFDATSTTQTMTSGSGITQSGNVSTYVYHGTGTISSWTVTLPAISSVGQWVRMFFDAPVTTLTISSTSTVNGTPLSSVGANTWITCMGDSTKAIWECGH